MESNFRAMLAMSKLLISRAVFFFALACNVRFRLFGVRKWTAIDGQG
jgi:hypothetical protein